MFAEDALVTLVRNTNLVGNRVYPMRRPQDSPLPSVLYQRITRIEEESHDGPSNLIHPRFSMYCWGDTYTEAKSVSRGLIAALNGYKGSVGGLRIDKIKVVNVLDDQEEEAGLYRVIVDAIMWHGKEEA